MLRNEYNSTVIMKSGMFTVLSHACMPTYGTTKYIRTLPFRTDVTHAHTITIQCKEIHKQLDSLCTHA